jgi:uncharacterized protein YuzE
MKPHLEIKVDREVWPPPAYIRYSRERRAGGYSVDPDGAVNVDLDAGGRVIGIELVEIRAYTMPLARKVALDHELDLPAAADGVRHAAP